MKSQDKILKKGSSLPGPYYLSDDGDLLTKRDPTEDEADAMLEWIVAYHEVGEWIVIRYLALLPTKYGETWLGKTVHALRKRYSQGRLNDFRGLGRRCLPGQVIPWLSVSHHLVLWYYYDIDQDERSRYIDLMDRHREQEDGKVWSVSSLIERIKTDQGVLPDPTRPRLALPGDETHELAVENDQLRQELFERDLTVSQVEQAVVALAPYLEDLASDDPATARAVARITEVIGGQSRPPVTNGRRLRLTTNDDGGYELIAADSNGSSKYLWEQGFPEWALEAIRNTPYYSE